jgi:hypothetical protein
MAVIITNVAVGITVLTFANEIYLHVSTLLLLSRCLSRTFKLMECILSDLTILQYPSRDIMFMNKSVDGQKVVARQSLPNFHVEISTQFMLVLGLHELFKEDIYIYTQYGTVTNS